MKPFDKNNYLRRIGLATDPQLNAEGLIAIHNAQHKTIPFENFDVILGKGINLDPNTLVSKLIDSKRGGYCFELNGLLLMALQHFGFNARSLLARVHLSGEATGRGHQLILVNLHHQSWIVDAGFGSQTPRSPIPFKVGKEVPIDNQTFMLSEHPAYGFMLQIKAGGEWKNLYSFDLSHVCKGDIEYGNHFTSTSLSSVFTSSCTAYLPLSNGGISLYNTTLKQHFPDGSTKHYELVNDNFFSALKEHFGIVLDPKQTANKLTKFLGITP